jgi:hypothetical protein
LFFADSDADLCVMKLRVDLLKQLTVADVVEEVAANQHRYKPEPTFSKTGTGHLSPRSTEDSVRGGAQHGANPEAHEAIV